MADLWWGECGAALTLEVSDGRRGADITKRDRSLRPPGGRYSARVAGLVAEALPLMGGSSLRPGIG